MWQVLKGDEFFRAKAFGVITHKLTNLFNYNSLRMEGQDPYLSAWLPHGGGGDWGVAQAHSLVGLTPKPALEILKYGHKKKS